VHVCHNLLILMSLLNKAGLSGVTHTQGLCCEFDAARFSVIACKMTKGDLEKCLHRISLLRYLSVLNNKTVILGLVPSCFARLRHDDP